MGPEQQTHRPGVDVVHAIRRGPVASGLNKLLRTRDNSLLHLIPTMDIKLAADKPIVFENRRFGLKDPMHSACAVLMVTGYGAELYARQNGLRMMRAAEWYAAMLTGNGGGSRMPLPTPVINYEQDSNGLRAINQIFFAKNVRGLSYSPAGWRWPPRLRTPLFQNHTFTPTTNEVVSMSSPSVSAKSAVSPSLRFQETPM